MLSAIPTPRLVAAQEMVTETRHVELDAPPGSPSRPRPAPEGHDEPLGSAEAARVAAEPGRARAVEHVDTFALLGVTLDQMPPAEVLVRVRERGSWSSWRPLEITPDHGPDPGAEAARPGVGSEPVWVGSADAYELSAPEGVGEADVHLVRTGPRVVSMEAPPAGAALAGPAIRTRASWAARAPSQAPFAAGDFRMAIVHHSVTGNAYSASEVPAILRSIQAYHMDGRGWSDIAYNFAVDRFGNVWEARAGGVSRAIVGGHSAGFNTYNTGVVVLGDYSSTAPSSASVAAVGELLAWKFAVHGVHPSGTVPYTTGGSPRFSPGTYDMPRIVGHGDVGLTSCPGALLGSRLDDIRSRVRARYPDYQAGRRVDGLVGDFNRDGRDDHMYYQPARSPERLRFGRASSGFTNGALDITGTYRLVSGDFDGDGADDVFLHGPGSYPDHVLHGSSSGFRRVSRAIQGSYRPFSGDFNGDGRDDVFWYGPGPGTDAVSYGAANGFVTRPVVVDTTFEPVVGDFDGDGRDDILWYRAGSTEDRIWYGTSTMGSFATPPVVNISGAYTPIAGDRNGDGRDDILFYGKGSAPDNQWTATATRGVFARTSFSMPLAATGASGRFDRGTTSDMFWYVPGSAPDPIWLYGTAGYAERLASFSGTSFRTYVGDFNGDGIDDLFLYRPGSAAYQWVFNGTGVHTELKVA